MATASKKRSPSNRPRPANPAPRAATPRANTKPRSKSKSESAAGMSDAAVRRATGKAWDQWFALLDSHGARSLTHAPIAELLATRLGVGPWWSQMVTVAYERSRNLRAKHQTPAGFQISASRTLNATPKAAFDAWTDAAQRTRWLPKTKLTIHKSTPHKSIRITWTDGAKAIQVMLYPKPNRRVQISVQHGKLPTAAAAQRMKSFWKARLAALDKAIG